ncbi:MAG: sigma-70 family RNA polymerase sigma factor [Planctomycetota bacterium]
MEVNWVGSSVGGMGRTSQQQVTQILGRIAEGHGSAARDLLPLVYDELRRLAASYMRRQPAGHTLQATALVHEAYMRLVGQTEVRWESRAHFFAVAATAMRQILANHARAKGAVKRGGKRMLVTLSEAVDPATGPEIDLLVLHDALEKLTALDEQQSRVVELRFFGGMTGEEIASVLDISPATVKREWRAARAWLNAELERNGAS